MVINYWYLADCNVCDVYAKELSVSSFCHLICPLAPFTI